MRNCGIQELNEMPATAGQESQVPLASLNDPQEKCRRCWELTRITSDDLQSKLEDPFDTDASMRVDLLMRAAEEVLNERKEGSCSGEEDLLRMSLSCLRASREEVKTWVEGARMMLENQKLWALCASWMSRVVRGEVIEDVQRINRKEAMKKLKECFEIEDNHDHAWVVAWKRQRSNLSKPDRME